MDGRNMAPEERSRLEKIDGILPPSTKLDRDEANCGV